MTDRFRYHVHGHQHKGRFVRQVLKAHGWRTDGKSPDLAFFDRDFYLHNDGSPRPQVIEFHEKGAKIVLYPHSALPPWWYDGLVSIYEHVDTVLVIGENQKRAMEIYCPGVRVIATGWPWSRQEEFQPCSEIRNVLFAPIHPSGGLLRPEAKDVNRRVFEALLALHPRININVRYMGNLQAQGLWEDRRVDWSLGKPDGRHHQIDRADLVIAEGTFMFLSVARGKPTIGLNQHLPIRTNKNPDMYTPENWSAYSHLLEYPIDFDDGPLPELMELAGHEEQTEWRRLLIGKSLCYTEFEYEMRKIANGRQLHHKRNLR